MTATSNQDNLLPLQIREELQAIVSLALRICDACEPRDAKEAPGNLRAHALSGAIQASAFQIHQLVHGRTFDEAEALAAAVERVIRDFNDDHVDPRKRLATLDGLRKRLEDYHAAREEM